ncbi:methionyl-tRNA formyltransferase [Patescibacteria group bacterium]|nr:methionyl-tRNA formyltransferase [Patescibacteria group bacterium]
MKKIIFFGTSEFAVPILESLIKNFEIVEVVTAVDKPAGRKKLLLSSPVKKTAQKLALRIYQPDNIKDQTVIKHIKTQQPDLLLSASFGQIFSKRLLEIPKFGSINIHASLLPKYRGASPIQAAILSRDKESGVTIILMEENIDAGKIITQVKVRVEECENTASLSNKLSLTVAKILPQTIKDWFKGQIIPEAQKENNATYTKKLNRNDGYINWQDPPKNLEQMIRAYYPWPGVSTLYEGKILKLLPNSKIQVEGKNPISLESFQQGHPDFKLLW